MINFSMRSIPAAAAMAAALLIGNVAQAQTATPPTAAGDKATMPAGPNTTPKTMEKRDAAKPMAKSGAMAGSSKAGDSSNMAEPTRQADKDAKDKADRMAKSSKPKAKMTKSGEPTREAEINK